MDQGIAESRDARSNVCDRQKIPADKRVGETDAEQSDGNNEIYQQGSGKFFRCRFPALIIAKRQGR